MSDKILTHAALTAAGVAAASLLAARPAQAALAPTTHVTLTFSAPPPTPSASALQIPNTSTNFPAGSAGVSPLDVQILNFALFVETQEAERYRQSIARLGSGGVDNFGNPITGLGLGSGDTGANLDILLVNGFAQTEMQQRDIIATTLYGAPNLNPFLSTSANTFGFAYDFGINGQSRQDVVANLSVAETVGVAAYLGGSGLLQIKSQFLAPSASFLGVEARHAASLAYAVNQLANAQVLHTAPLVPGSTTPSDIANSLTIPGADQPLTADAILNSGGMVSPGLLPPALGGKTPIITGPTGFTYLANGQ